MDSKAVDDKSRVKIPSVNSDRDPRGTLYQMAEGGL